MSSTFTYHFDTPTYKGVATVPTGLFINGKFVEPVEKGTIEYVLVFIATAAFRLTNVQLT
jgi:aldehyde dehydrogenase (NAD+)